MDQGRIKFTGKIIEVEVRRTTLPNAMEVELEIVHHPGGSAVVVLDKRGKICLLKQYRAVFDEWLWELPAGKRDHQEPPLQTAQRELAEEAGIEAGRWIELGSVISSPGVFGERVYLYLATELNHVEANSGADEVFEIQWVPMTQAYQWALQGQIEDAKTVAGIVRAFRLLGERGN